MKCCNREHAASCARDVCQNQNEPVMTVADDKSLLETMRLAAEALQCRAAAGHTQLSSAMLSGDVKQSLIDDAATRMTARHTATATSAQFTVLSALPTDRKKR